MKVNTKIIIVSILGLIFVLGATVSLFGSAFDYDGCCEDHGQCNSLACQCSCTIIMFMAENGSVNNIHGLPERLTPYSTNHIIKDLPFEFYRPPERQAS